jgi:hypothetical protein
MGTDDKNKNVSFVKIVSAECYKDMQNALKDLLKSYHLIPGAKKSLHPYIEALEKELMKVKTESGISQYNGEEKKVVEEVLIINDDTVGDKLESFCGTDSFCIITKNKRKTFMLKNASNETIKKTVVIPGNMSLYRGKSKSTHINFMSDIIYKMIKQKAGEYEPKMDDIKLFAHETVTGEHCHSGRYDEKKCIAYIWDMPNEEMSKALKKHYKKLKEIRY